MRHLSLNIQKILLFTLFALSITAWIISYRQGLILVYNDAMSHINLARLVYDNQEPGLAQMGGVWLPANRIATMSLVWIDPLWRTGLAGSIFSMLSYVGAAFLLYQIIFDLLQNKRAAVVTSLVYALNLNILYLQTTPLTESMYNFFFILSVYFCTRWIKTNNLYYLFALGTSGFAQVLSRYDGWFVVAVIGLIVIAYEFLVRKSSLSETFAKGLFYATPVAFAISLWLLWGMLIYNDPFYFALGPHSARAQQDTIANRSGLVTKHNWGKAIEAYYYTAIDNVGLYLIILAIIGTAYFLLSRHSLSHTARSLLVLLWISPILFNILALYLGFSIVNVPELNWRPNNDPNSIWFNVRYGIFTLPFVALGMGIVASRSRVNTVFILLCLTIQTYMLYNRGIITVIDGTIGSSSFQYPDIAEVIRSDIPESDTILLSNSYFNPVAFQADRPLRQFVHEGVSKYWSTALQDPQAHVDWIIMSSGNIGEPVHTALVQDQQSRFLQDFKLHYQGKHANIYRLKQNSERAVYVFGTTFMLHNEEYRAVGVNAYDMLYRTPEEITTSLDELEKIGVNTIRFWAFGDGNSDGVQPEAGIFNEDRLLAFDHLLVEAKKRNIRLIPTLVNNWADYGGKAQYLRWIGKDPVLQEEAFYSDPAARGLYKNMLDHILSRQNTLSGQNYAEDPTILAWDIINEPRISRGADQSVAAWTDEMARYIKAHTSQQLVTIGTEELTPSKIDNSRVPYLCNSPAIDFCSVHPYLIYENKMVYKTQTEFEQFLDTQAAYAQNLNKPVVLEEFGIEKAAKPFNKEPLVALAETLSYTAPNYQGVLIWNWSLQNDTTFGFSPNGNDNGTYSAADLRQLLQVKLQE